VYKNILFFCRMCTLYWRVIRIYALLNTRDYTRVVKSIFTKSVIYYHNLNLHLVNFGINGKVI